MSFVIKEFTCQYSDQIRKKHKTWHDGKLKYSEFNNRFQLFTEDGVQLSSKLLTNSKQVADILNDESYGIEEHRIFGSYFVIILELSSEYIRDESKSANSAIIKSEYGNRNKTPIGSVKQSQHIELNQKRASKTIASVSDTAKKPFKRPIILSHSQSNLQNTHIKADPDRRLTEDTRLRQEASDKASAERITAISQECFRSSLNVSQTTELNEVSAASLDPVEYIRQTNSILKTGRLRQKNYVIRNSPIVL